MASIAAHGHADALAVSLSLGRIPVLAGQVAWVLVGLAGIGFITLWVPTNRSPTSRSQG